MHRICKEVMSYKKVVERKVPWWNREIEDKRKIVNKSKKRIKILKKQNKLEEKERKKAV
jgi:hypothetical protein